MAVQTESSPLFAAANENRRRADRRPHVCEAWVRSPTDTDEDKIEVTSLDISRHGVAFHSPQRLAEGCFYWVEIGFGAQRIASEVRVSSCTQSDIAPGIWRVGGKFC